MIVDWWTLGLQTVNLVVLIWLLGRFFWRPVAAAIEERRATATRILDEAAAKRAEATEALAEVERARAGLSQERETILAAAHDAAKKALAAGLDEALQEAAAQRASAAADIEKDKAAAARAWSDRATDLAVEIAGKLASRLALPAVRAAFLDWLTMELQRLPDPERQVLAANGVHFQAVSAAPLDADERETVRTRIETALGGRPEIAFSVDPALIAGLELHGPNLEVRNSWRADLDRILADLAHDTDS